MVREPLMGTCGTDRRFVGGRGPAGRQLQDGQLVAEPFLRKRLDGLTDDPRPGVPRTITDAQV